MIATDQATPPGRMPTILRQLSGEPATVVLLATRKRPATASKSSSKGTSRWMVAVRMVSEGVDVPRLSVGVYATSASTPLFFAQAIGRFVRARRRGEIASVFLPNVPMLMSLAAQLELERDHALDRIRTGDEEADLYNPEDAMVAEANRDDKASDRLQDLFAFEALASEANFDRVLYDGAEFGSYAVPGSDEEHDFIGLPGILEPDQVHELLTQRQARQARRGTSRPQQGGSAENAAHPPAPLYRNLKEQRSLLNSLVGLYAKNTGEAHGLVHAELRRVCGGPAVAQASVTQLQARIDFLRRRLGS